MGRFWLVIPNPSQPSLAVNFEVFGEVHTARTLNEAMAVSEQHGDPLAVVIGVPVEGLRQRVQWARQQFPHSRLYLAGGISPFQLAGLDITYVVTVPLPADFVKMVRRELDLEDALGHTLPAAPASFAPVVPASEESASTTPREPQGKDQIVVVFSGKGGDGKTTIAAQLAILLAKRGFSTLLIDADYKGDAAEWFRGMSQPPIHGILDFRTEEPKDRALIDSYLIEKNGLKILPCPQVEVGPIHPRILERAIQAYKPFYQMIVLDMHQGFSPELLLASQYASKFIAVTIPAERRFYPFSMTLSQLTGHRVSKKNLHIVVNKTHRGEADIRKVRTAIQDVLGESFSRYHALPAVPELSYDDDPEFVAITDMKGSEPYPVAFVRMAEEVMGMSLRTKSENRDKNPSGKESKEKSKKGHSGGWLSKVFGTAPKKKPVRKGGKKR